MALSKTRRRPLLLRYDFSSSFYVVPYSPPYFPVESIAVFAVSSIIAINDDLKPVVVERFTLYVAPARRCIRHDTFFFCETE